MGEVRLGTSGWSYREWIGSFYPDEKTKKLSYDSKVFNTAEIDSTFYVNDARKPPTLVGVMNGVRFK